jgi:hypothetical protein
LYVAATLNQNIDSRKQKYVPNPQVALDTLQICRIRRAASQSAACGFRRRDLDHPSARPE